MVWGTNQFDKDLFLTKRAKTVCKMLQSLQCTCLIIMPPTLKKLMGHIAFGACVGGSHFFVPTVTF